MAEGLTDREQFLQRIDRLALSVLPIEKLPMVAAPPTHHDGVMVALVPDEPEQLALDHDEALPANDLHVTLTYHGKVQDLSSFDKTEILTKTRRACDAVGQTFTTNADGVVVMGKNDRGVPATALLIQSDEIVTLYETLAEALNYKSSYPSFIPHMTTGYGVPVEDAQSRVGQPISFSKVIVKFGDDFVEVPLSSALTAAPRGANVIDRVIDSLGRLWDEALHPRDGEGRFIKKNGAVTGKLAVPTRDRKSVTMVDANRASVVGFHTFGDEVWVLAEITNDDGTKTQGFARATAVRAVAPVKARLDVLYPIDERGDSFINSSLERKRQLDLLLSYITTEYGPGGDEKGAKEFIESLGLRQKDLDYIYGGSDDTKHLGGIRRIYHELGDDEMDEAEDIIEDARAAKALRERIHGLKEGPGGGYVVDDEASDVKSVDDLMRKYEDLGVDSFVSEKADLITLSKVVVGDRSKGTGSAFMQDLIDYADRSGKKIGLSPASDFGGSKPRLIEFYKRFGFVENKGKNRDYEVTETMYRLPEPFSSVDTPSLEPHVAPKQQLLQGTPPDQETVDALKAGADPFSLSTSNLLGAMQESGRFNSEVPSGATGISPIEWMTDPNDPTGVSAGLAGTGRATTERAYFVKQSILGAQDNNTDIVNEVTASLIAENVAAEGDDRLLRVPRAVFGDNPEWDGETPPEAQGFDMSRIHQPAHVVSQHAAYLIPADWNTTDAASEEVALRNDIRSLDRASQEDQQEAFYEDIGNLYGNDIAKMVLWDFVLLNGDRNPGNAILASSSDGTEAMVVPIDHGMSFDDPPLHHKGIDSTFEWFMNYQLTRAWLNYVRGGLNLDDRVTEESLRQVIQDFTETYGRMDGDQVTASFRALPGVTDAQIERVEGAIAGVVDRIAWLRDNMETVLQKIVERGRAAAPRNAPKPQEGVW